MTLNELSEKYYLHDSCIDKITFDENTKVLVFQIDFCYWAQENYEETTPENGDVNLVFHGVKNYSGITGVIDHYSILDAENRDGGFYLSVLDDFHNEHYEFTIAADSVDFVEISTPPGA